jgi:hypothetical protein
MTDVDIWTYGEMDVGDIDVTGYSIEARDGEIGKIDEATYETGASYLVVDTGPWIFGKRVMLPAGTVERFDLESERVFVRLTKDEIKDAPEFDPELHGRDETRRRELGDYYAGSHAGTGMRR